MERRRSRDSIGPVAAAVWVLALAATAGGGPPAAAGLAGEAAPVAAPSVTVPDSLITTFEASAGRRTPTHEQTVAYARRLAAAFPELTYTTFGTSPHGRELPLIVADPAGRIDPAAVRRDPGRAVVLIQACIHPGESCGKDAGFLLLRDLALAGWPGGLLESTTLLFVPIVNADGHERFGPYHRANQDGPEEMGWRVNARNLNLNRDFLKADAAETRDWLRLWTAWLPDFFVDIHSTDGADYQYPVTWQMELEGNLDADLAAWSGDLLTGVAADLAAEGIPVGPYITFRRWDDPTSGLVSWVAGPRFSQGYAAVQNRPGLLLEAHMIKPYPERVHAVRRLLEHAWQRTAAVAADLRARNLAADERTAAEAFRTAAFPLTFALREESEPFEYLGFEHEHVESDVTGGSYYRYDPSRPRTFEVPFFRRHAPETTVSLPAAYLVPPEWDDVIARLEAHGLELVRLAGPAEVRVRSYRFVSPRWREQPYEGRHPVRFEVEPVEETRTFPAGTVIVDVRQRAARVIAHALEPQGPDSFAAWGFFDSVFLPVEYIEPRVIEAMIPSLLEDADLARRFHERRAADPEFAADPRAIREWFYRQTPYADQRAGLYPVGLVDDPEVVRALAAAPRQ
ncbi:MAG: M14 family metallopeptidase [Candidatus Krumholzibacteriia bacterium]